MHDPPTWTATQKAQILVAAQRRRASAGAGETRVIAGLTAEVEKRALAWMAARMPDWVTPDHLTVLGLLAMLLGGAAYAASGRHPWLLLVVNGALALNWFGDSLDGTLARFRQRQRPRYGFYVDHIADAIGALGLLGGLALSGLASPPLVWALVLVYYLFSIHMYLATHALGRFQISYGPVGGTELRILLGLVNLVVLALPEIRLFGYQLALFDVLVAGGILALLTTLAVSVARATRELYDLERL